MKKIVYFLLLLLLLSCGSRKVKKEDIKTNSKERISVKKDSVSATERSEKTILFDVSTIENMEFVLESDKDSMGKMPPVKAIEEWIQAKGIRPLEKKISVSSLAYAIAHKIGREGTRRFKAGGKPEFIDAVITAERIQDIIDKVGAWYTVQFSSDIIKVIEEMAA